MFLATDTHYTDQGARTSGVLFRAAEDAQPFWEGTISISNVAEYEPGAFYKRELPCILALLESIPHDPISTIMIDGYVDLDHAASPGLGRYLYDAMGHSTIVIGVAKTAFKASPHAAHVLRGQSERPLFVTAAGIPLADAVILLDRMHGPHRIPTLLKRADQLCRSA